MNPKGNLLDDYNYKKLQEYYNENKDKLNMNNMFKLNPSRFETYR